MTDVLVTAPFDQRLLDKIRSVSPRIALDQIRINEREWPANRSIEAEIFYAIGALPPPEQAPNLRWIQTHWAGVDHLRDHPIWKSDIVITNSSGVHAPNVAQYVMAQILAWANRVPRWLAFQQRSEWADRRWERFVPDELRGKTLGIAGYGSIGREVARLARCFGMRVLATKRDARHVEDVDYSVTGLGDPSGELAARLYPGEATRSMVSECDYVVCTLPLTSETGHLFDEELFRAMKPSAYFVNVGRGGVVDQGALVKALKKGWVAGAGLDVFEEEPLPENSALWQMENVIISPHVSGFTNAYDERVTDLFAENIRRYLAGEPLLNVVDRQRQY